MKESAGSGFDFGKVSNRELCKIITGSGPKSSNNAFRLQLLTELRRRERELKCKDWLCILRGSSGKDPIADMAFAQYVRNEYMNQPDMSLRIHKLVVLVELIPAAIHGRVPSIITDLLATVDSLEPSNIVELLFVLNKTNCDSTCIIPHLSGLAGWPHSLPPARSAAVLLASFRLELGSYIPWEFYLKCIAIVSASVDTTPSDITLSLLSLMMAQASNPRIRFPVSTLLQRLVATNAPLSEIDRHQLMKGLSILILNGDGLAQVREEIIPLDLEGLINSSGHRPPPTNSSRTHLDVVNTLKRITLHDTIKSEVYVPCISSYIDILVHS